MCTEGVKPEDVTRVVLEEYTRFDGRPIRDFVPSFVERHSTARLSTLAEA